LGKSDEIWAKAIRFGQNQNIASPKTLLSPTVMSPETKTYEILLLHLAIDLAVKQTNFDEQDTFSTY